MPLVTSPVTVPSSWTPPSSPKTLSVWSETRLSVVTLDSYPAVA